jgi:hypothetical protein
MKLIIKSSINFLVEQIRSYDKYDVQQNLIEKLFENESFGKLKVDKDALTFIDIIKGIFPLKLFDLLLNQLKMKKEDLYQVSVNFLDNVYDLTSMIWKERCDTQLQKEKKFKSYDPDVNKNKRPLNSLTPFDNAEGLKNAIYFNMKPMDFTIYVNRTYNNFLIYFCVIVSLCSPLG